MALLQLIAILWGPYLIVGAWIVIKAIIERR